LPRVPSNLTEKCSEIISFRNSLNSQVLHFGDGISRRFGYIVLNWFGATIAPDLQRFSIQ
jgi:hypothetical protein